MVSRFWRGLLTTTTRSSNGFAALSPTASWENVNYRRRILRQTSSRRDGGQVDTRPTVFRGRLRGPLSGQTARLARGRGLNCSKKGRPATAPGLTRRFFLPAPKLLISLSEIKNSNGVRGKLCRPNKDRHLPLPPLLWIYFPGDRNCILENCREIPWGGVLMAAFNEGSA